MKTSANYERIRTYEPNTPAQFVYLLKYDNVYHFEILIFVGS